MIDYFKELLKTLKSIDSHLAKLSKCVKVNQSRHGDDVSLSTKHWNE